MEISHPVITAGNAPRLDGVASSATGTAPNCSNVGGTVTLSERRYGESSYRQVATAETDSNNRFTFTVRPLVQTMYQASFRGQTSNAATVLVRVHRRMDFTSTGPTFAGRLTPAEALIPVGLAYIDLNGRYRYLAQTVADTAGNFSITVRLPRGTFTYVVYTSPRQGLLRGTRSIRFTS